MTLLYLTQVFWKALLPITCISLILACLFSFFLKGRRLFIVALVSIFLLLLQLVAPVVGSRFTHDFQPKTIFSSKISSVSKAFDLMEMTQVMSSGEIVRAGILKELPEVDVRRVVPSIEGYRQGENLVFWSYAFEPHSFHREGTTIIMIGHRDVSDTLFFGVIDREFVSNAALLTGRDIE